MKQFEFRDIRADEADQAVQIEQICFPPNEACTERSMVERTNQASDLFLVAEDKQTGKIAGFLNGIATSEERFRDPFFSDITLCDRNGDRIMLLGLDVLPEYRGQGLATALVSEYIRREKAKDRKVLVLTCVDDKVKMYEKMGFVDLGMANSNWGGEHWHEMRYDIK